MPKLRLTQQHLDRPPPCPPGKRRIEYCDTLVSGLYLEVRDTNAYQGTLYLRHRNAAGKTAHTKIGTSQDLSLGVARKKAKQLKAEIANGKDPQAEARQRKAVPTWNQFFEDSYLPHAKQVKRTWKNDADMQRLRLSDRFGATPVNAITRQSVQQFHNELREEGMAPATADHHLKLIRHALNMAVDWGLLTNNPTAKVKQFNADNQVERYLSEEELQRLLKVLKAHKNRPVCCAILWLLATGARVGEALSAEWTDIDRSRRTWVIQAKNSKSKKRRSVVLNDVALSVLDELEARTRHKPQGRLFVGKRGPLGTINKVWYGIRDKAALGDFRLHDLRHSYASMLVNAGHSLYEVQQALGHSDPKVTMRYAHLSKDSLQQAANSASDAISAAMAK
ncbi:tyrosine-type recombinase/integrase [Congregibacter variabilis]|uniref:Tyrosine-type recombinase/integrase n=1 Tax=Congregibacter variabilis TaxID=3081200 RepID=A0ABZ0I188_9GAMM|nr:tyrosine-type recombinase/integrase [Congregibacter sp. IMCC43200]